MDVDLMDAASVRLAAAEAAHECASAPVNVPLNFVFSKHGCAMMSFELKAWHQLKPQNLTISGDIKNMYNDTDQPTDEDGNPDPEGFGREKMFAWLRKRFPELLPSARLVFGQPTLI